MTTSFSLILRGGRGRRVTVPDDVTISLRRERNEAIAPCGRLITVRAGESLSTATTTKEGRAVHMTDIRQVLATTYHVSYIRYGRKVSTVTEHLGLSTTTLGRSIMTTTVTTLKAIESPLTCGIST